MLNYSTACTPEEKHDQVWKLSVLRAGVISGAWGLPESVVSLLRIEQPRHSAQMMPDLDKDGDLGSKELQSRNVAPSYKNRAEVYLKCNFRDLGTPLYKSRGTQWSVQWTARAAFSACWAGRHMASSRRRNCRRRKRQMSLTLSNLLRLWTCRRRRGQFPRCWMTPCVLWYVTQRRFPRAGGAALAIGLGVDLRVCRILIIGSSMHLPIQVSRRELRARELFAYDTKVVGRSVGLESCVWSRFINSAVHSGCGNVAEERASWECVACKCL